jgi:hypothetical protein
MGGLYINHLPYAILNPQPIFKKKFIKKGVKRSGENILLNPSHNS